jgi:hypothetical protein
MPERSVFRADDTLVVVISDRITLTNLADLLALVMRQFETSPRIRQVFVADTDDSSVDLGEGFVQTLSEQARGEGVRIHHARGVDG